MYRWDYGTCINDMVSGRKQEDQAFISADREDSIEGGMGMDALHYWKEKLDPFFFAPRIGCFNNSDPSFLLVPMGLTTSKLHSISIIHATLL